MKPAARIAALAATVAVVAATSACSASGGGGSTTPTCANPTYPTAVPTAAASLTSSTTTSAAGEIVKTSFPTLQGQPFAQVPVISSTNGVLSTSFDVKKQKFSVAGREINGMAYAGQFMGPTLRVNPGDTIKISETSELTDPTNLHTHGLHTSPIDISDNIFRSFTDGTTNEVVIEVPKNVAPGTYWYHTHIHGYTEGQVFSGLAGALEVTGLTERLPKDLQGVQDNLLALRDIQIQDDTILTQNIDSNAPTTRTVNGQVNPVLQGQPGCTQLLRIGGWSPDIWYRLQMDGAKFYVIAEDANPVTTVQAHDTLLVAPGKRFDVLVTWPKAGTYHLRTLPMNTGPEGDQYPERVLATWDIGGEAVAPSAMPQDMGPLPAELQNTMDKDPIAKHHVVVLSEDNAAGKFMINGSQFHTTKPLFVMKLGTTEEWTIKNVTGEDHPFHIHVNDFQVMSINGVPYESTGLVDTFKVPAHGEIVIRQRFLDFVGKYVFHCHILAHEDAGMMAAVEVSKDGLPADDATLAQWGQPNVDMNMTGMDMGTMGG